MNFNYKQAFSRNKGIFTEQEQEKISKAKVALVGMGGVGGEYLITLVRMGFQNFKICDFDEFELKNFNRQFGANTTSIGQPKTLTMKKMALEINPNCSIEVLNEAITENNISDFLEGVDVVVNGIDFFVVEAHELLINNCIERGITVHSGLPLGFGVGFVSFGANSPSFNDYFQTDRAKTREEKLILLALGFGFAGFHLKYVDPQSICLTENRGPSVISGIKISAALMGTKVAQSVLWPEQIKMAPYATQIDLKLSKLVQKKIMGGNNNLLQRIKFLVAKMFLGKSSMAEEIERKVKKTIFHCIMGMPKAVRHLTIRYMPARPLSWPSNVEVKVAESPEEFEAAFKLLHSCYMEKNKIDEQSSRMKIIRQNLLPSTTVIIAKFDGRVVGTVSIIRPSIFGLPLEEKFKLSRLMLKENVAEISSLAVAKGFRGPGSQVLFPLLKYLFHFCREYAAIDRMIARSTDRRVQDFYEEVLCFSEIAPRCKQSKLFTLDLLEAPKLLHNKYSGRNSIHNLYDFFIVQKMKNSTMPSKKYNVVNTPGLSPSQFHKVFFKQGQAALSLEAKDVIDLHKVYHVGPYRQVLPKLPTKVVSFSKRVAPRHQFWGKAQAKLIDRRGSTTLVKVKSVSHSGVCTSQIANCKVGDTIYLQIQIAKNLVSNVEARVCRVERESGEVGMRITNCDQNWQEMIDRLNMKFYFNTSDETQKSVA